LFESMKYIDIDKSELVTEFITYSYIIGGLMPMNLWFKLRYDEYMMVKNEMEMLKNAIKKGSVNG